VSQPIVTDNRDSYEWPTGTKDEVVQVCEGTGVWSDGTNDHVRLRLMVDSDG
jgi:hypothetical protein